MSPRFRPNTCDQACWEGIVNGNEYRLPATLDPNELIVDIGSHVGSFVMAAWLRGARNIESFEADPANFAIAHDNVGLLPGVTVSNYAVGRSDHMAKTFACHGGYTRFPGGMVNTGGGTVVGVTDGPRVPAIPLDDIAPDHVISLLKIDCEGSEWPILYTCDMLRIKAICGEYHTIDRDVEDGLGLPYACTPQRLESFLRQHFEHVEVQPHSEAHAKIFGGQKIGLFFAR